jgi:hypothetical protein
MEYVMKKRQYICTAKPRNIQMCVEYWILFPLYNAMLIFYSSASKWNCGIVRSLWEVDSRADPLKNLPGLLRFRLVLASVGPCRASRRGIRASSGQLDRDRGVRREYFRRVEEPSGLGWLRHAGSCPLPASRAPRLTKELSLCIKPNGYLTIRLYAACLLTASAPPSRLSPIRRGARSSRGSPWAKLR